jgi:predicted dehydrogenase
MSVTWGLVGTGTFADMWAAPAIAADPLSALGAVCSRDLGRAAQFAERHGAAGAYDSYADMLADPAVDAVYVISPNSLHAEQALAAVEAGKHVLVEKPMTLTRESASGVTAAAERAGVKLGVGFHLRHKASNAYARDLARSGRLGPVFSAEITIAAGKGGPYPYDTWRADPDLAGAGTLVNQAVHVLDLLCFLTDQTIVEISALADQQPLDDVFVAACRMSGGTLATVTSHQLRAGARPGYVLVGPHGWLDSQTGTSPVAADTIALHLDNEVQEETTPAADNPCAAEVAAFAHAVSSGDAVEGDGTAGTHNVAVVEAAQTSLREGRSVRVEG